MRPAFEAPHPPAPAPASRWRVANPALHVILLDSNRKKEHFLRHAQCMLPLTFVEVP